MKRWEVIHNRSGHSKFFDSYADAKESMGQNEWLYTVVRPNEAVGVEERHARKVSRKRGGKHTHAPRPSNPCRVCGR